MQRLIKDGVLADDPWTLLKEATGPEILKVVSGKNFIVPLQFWKSFQTEIEEYSGGFSIWLDSHENVDDIESELASLPLIALNFPAFADGRSYTNARELREHYKYEGEIRAIGDVLRDQIYYMKRCGFDAFEIRHDQNAEECISALADFKTGYQSSIDETLPLYRRR